MHIQILETCNEDLWIMTHDIKNAGKRRSGPCGWLWLARGETGKRLSQAAKRSQDLILLVLILKGSQLVRYVTQA